MVSQALRHIEEAVSTFLTEKWRGILAIAMKLPILTAAEMWE
jgi:hypothetical protein